MNTTITLDGASASLASGRATAGWISSAPDLDNFSQDWSRRLAADLDGFQAVRLRIAGPDGILRFGADQVGDGQSIDRIEPVLNEAHSATRKHGTGVARALPDGLTVAAYPLSIDGRLAAIAVLVLGDGWAPEATLERLRWAMGWVRARLLDDARTTDAPSIERARQAVALLGSALEEEGFTASARRAVTELARLARCDRVSVGFRRAWHARVVALSDVAIFGRRMDIVRRLEAAMDEAISQQAVVLDPQPEGTQPLATREHSLLRRSTGAAHVLTIPIYARGRFRGAICFERMAEDAFDQGTIDLAAAATGLVGQMLEDRRRADRWLIVKAWDGLVRAARVVIGAGHFQAKLTLIVVAILGLLAGTIRAPDTVTADARVEGAEELSLIAPFEGYVAAADARAGDIVEEGAVLARLDDRDLSLERLNWLSERRRRVLEYEKAIGERDRARQNVMRAEIEQADAQIAFLDAQISRSQIKAPFGGVIVYGDLSQKIGGAVSRGEPLFRVAPLKDYRIVLWVDESRIDDVFAAGRGAWFWARCRLSASRLKSQRSRPSLRPATGATCSVSRPRSHPVTSKGCAPG